MKKFVVTGNMSVLQFYSQKPYRTCRTLIFNFQRKSESSLFFSSMLLFYCCLTFLIYHFLGIHNAKNEKKTAHGWGTAFTLELKEWIESKYSEWTSVMGTSSKAVNLGSAPQVFQEKPVISWNVFDVAVYSFSFQTSNLCQN